jgi:NAD(P)-dependent dehydrogenase (short-subunit alcohol dehydrogenase family)
MSKVWFITGAGSGIGAGTMKAAVKAGDRVVATGRNLDKVRHALQDLADNENVALLPLDVTDEAQAQRAIDQAVARFGGIDVLVNNAGYCLLGNFEELDMQDIQRQFSTNLWGVMHVMRAALPVMRRQRRGHIINLSSVGGVVAMKHASVYGATKFAVEGLTLAVAQEVERFGIRVTVVEPGFFRTDLLTTRNVRFPSGRIGDYAGAEEAAERMWAVYDGKQPRDPDKLGEVLVTLVGMDSPPQIFVAGSDAISMVAPAVEGRLKAVHALESLSTSTDGDFEP